MVRLLLENGADPNARESPRKIGNPGRGWTPLTLGIGREDVYEVIQVLLQYGADAGADSEPTLCAVSRKGKSDDFFWCKVVPTLGFFDKETSECVWHTSQTVSPLGVCWFNEA